MHGFASNLVMVALCFDWLNFAQTCAVALCVVGEILRLNRQFCGGCVAGNLAQKFMAVAKKFGGEFLCVLVD